jgi:ABC-type nitrate/sulfonate/bicarbonate transport system permease component
MGIGEVSKIGFTYASFFPMSLTSIHGVLHVDPLLLRAAASLGASQSQQFYRVVLPAAFAKIRTGFRLGVAPSFFVIVISEFIAAEHGFGFLINDGRNFFLVPQLSSYLSSTGFRRRLTLRAFSIQSCWRRSIRPSSNGNPPWRSDK